MRIKGHEPRCAEDYVLIKIFKIILAETELYTHGEELFSLPLQSVDIASVAGGDLAAVFGKQLYKRGIAHADTDNGYAFAFYRVDIF